MGKFLSVIVHKSEAALTIVAGTALVLMMLIVVFDIIGRSLGIWHILSTVEQIKLYMMILAYFGLALTFRTQANIVVDVATHALPESVRNRIDALWSICTAILLLPLAYYVLENGFVQHGFDRRSEVLGLSPLLHHTIASFGLAVAALVSILVTLRLFTGSSDDNTTDHQLNIE